MEVIKNDLNLNHDQKFKCNIHCSEGDLISPPHMGLDVKDIDANMIR